ncbi:MAG: hypothetical protein CL821_00205 [Crocinitomicaceae bacterium]|nr:hypothetical protein [Crocinitomicaceae bacterium]|tara:strand:+ start:8344 stop:8955 length:612 start_codon:yes stop_codon:yes gene_type:complete
MIRLIIIFLFIFQSSIYSQSFEGLITYSITHNYIDSSLKNKVMPSKLDFYISGELARIDQHTKIGIQTTIIDTLINKHILLIQLMDKKFGIIINEENDTNELEKITYTNDQKLFQNIICNKAIINNNNSTSVVYFTNEINNAYNINFKKLKGFPLYYEIISPDFISSYEVSKITKQAVDPMLFEIDKNTSIYTMKDFQSLMSQ